MRTRKSKVQPLFVTRLREQRIGAVIDRRQGPGLRLRRRFDRPKHERARSRLRRKRAIKIKLHSRRGLVHESFDTAERLFEQCAPLPDKEIRVMKVDLVVRRAHLLIEDRWHREQELTVTRETAADLLQCSA